MDQCGFLSVKWFSSLFEEQRAKCNLDFNLEQQCNLTSQLEEKSETPQNFNSQADTLLLKLLSELLSKVSKKCHKNKQGCSEVHNCVTDLLPAFQNTS